MRAFFLSFVLAFLAGHASATDATEIDLVLKGEGGLVIRLTGAPCEIMLPFMALSQTIPGAQPRMAHVMANGRDARACWAVDAEDDVLVVTESGGGGWIPLKAFKADNGI